MATDHVDWLNIAIVLVPVVGFFFLITGMGTGWGIVDGALEARRLRGELALADAPRSVIHGKR